jgi:hypothetical protein
MMHDAHEIDAAACAVLIFTVLRLFGFFVVRI